MRDVCGCVAPGAAAELQPLKISMKLKKLHDQYAYVTG